MKYFESIKFKLIITILIILIPLIEFEFFNINRIYDHQAKNELDASVELGQAIANSFYNYVEDLWEQESLLSTYIISNPQLSQEEICRYLKGLRNTQETTKLYFWVNPDGIIIGSAVPKTLGISLRDNEYVKRIIAGEEKAIFDLTTYYGVNEPILSVARGIRKDGKLLGIMVASVDISKLGERFSNLNLGEQDVLSFIDTKGTVVYSSNNHLIYLMRQSLPDNAPGRNALNGQVVKNSDRKSKYNGIIKMNIALPIKAIGWACTIESNYNVAVKGYYKETRDAILMFTFIVLFSIAAALLLGMYILRPINSLKYAAKKIMDGDYSYRVNITGGDEIAVTAQAFDRMAEGIQQYDKLKTQFFSNISHELKTPLNVIFAASQLLITQENSVTEKQYRDEVLKYVKVVRQNGYRLLRLINNIIDISKFDNGYLKMKAGNYNIVYLIEDITLSVVKYAEHKGINLIFDTDTEEKIIVCDSDMIERIILNLLSNAIKFTDNGGSIFVNVYDKGDKVQICVKDTGIGIPEDKLDVIFERFGQVESSLNRNTEGSGIGLSLVKALVEAHKGTISVKSKLNEGTEFIMELPAAQLDENYVKTEYNSIPVSNEVQKIDIEFSDIYSNL